MYYEDYVEAEIARDYCRLFNRPFQIPRHDWGGEHYFFGQKLKYGNLKVPDKGNGSYISASHYADSNDIDHSSSMDCTLKEKNTCNRQVYKLIMENNEIDAVKRDELIRGEIMNMFNTTSTRWLRHRHPKDRLVSFCNLKTFACMVDSVTKCPLIHLEVQESLQQGWYKCQQIKETKEVSQELKKDMYNVPEHVKSKIQEILKERLKAKQEAKHGLSLVAPKPKRGSQEKKPTCTVGGGRYEI